MIYKTFKEEKSWIINVYPNKIPIISRSICANIDQSSILKIERYNRKINVLTDEQDYWYYGKMDNLEIMLNDDFYRYMDGCYLNLHRIRSLSEQTVVFDNGMTYSMGRSNFIKTKQRFARHLIETYSIKKNENSKN